MARNPSVHTNWLRVPLLFVAVFLFLIVTSSVAQQVRGEVEGSAAQRVTDQLGPKNLERAKLKQPGARGQGVDTDLFFPATVYGSGGNAAWTVALADLNGDHKTDVVVANYGVEPNGDSTVGVLLGKADGTFRPVVAYDTGAPNSFSVAVGDLNGDGKLDVVLGNAGISNSVSVLLGHGDGTFAPAVVYSTGTSYDNWSMPVLISDLNRDGNGDVVVLSQYSIAVLLGKPDGTLEPAVNSYFGPGGPLTTLALADLNNDGKLDAVTLTCSQYCVDNEAYLWLGNGDGTFGPAGHIGGGGGNAQAPIVVADINNDGISDLVFGDGGLEGGGGGISVLIGNGDGTFRPETNYELPHTGGVTSIVVTDLNGDGMPDIAAASESLNVFLNNGDGTFHLTQTNATSPATLVSVADLNRDGKPDLLLLEPSAGVVEALLGNGDGTFSGGGLFFPTGGSPSDMVVIDLNGDGRPDVLVSNSDQAGSIGVLLNNKNFVFSHTTTALHSSLNPSVYGQSTNLTAVVTADSGTATGTVAFITTDGGNTFGSANLVNGQATLSASLGAGSNSIFAAYQGSENFGASISSPLIQVVQMATTTTALSSSHNPAMVGQTVVYTPSVQSQYGGAVFGTITLYDGATVIGSFRIGGKKSTVKQTYTAPGTHTITANYSGDGSNIGSVSAPLSEQILGQTTTAVSTSGSPSQVGQPVTFTAKVASKYGSIPDGELVTFYDLGKVLGTEPLSGGTATLTTSTLKAKQQTIKVVYPGDSTFKTSQGTVVQVVEP